MMYTPPSIGRSAIHGQSRRNDPAVRHPRLRRHDKTQKRWQEAICFWVCSIPSVIHVSNAERQIAAFSQNSVLPGTALPQIGTRWDSGNPSRMPQSALVDPASSAPPPAAAENPRIRCTCGFSSSRSLLARKVFSELSFQILLPCLSLRQHMFPPSSLSIWKNFKKGCHHRIWNVHIY